MREFILTCRICTEGNGLAMAPMALEESRDYGVAHSMVKATCGLAVQAAQKGTENSYSVVFGRAGRQAAFSAKAFLRYIGWSCDRRQTFRATWDEPAKMFEVKLPSR